MFFLENAFLWIFFVLKNFNVKNIRVKKCGPFKIKIKYNFLRLFDESFDRTRVLFRDHRRT